jgi:hypothetical protein
VIAHAATQTATRSLLGGAAPAQQTSAPARSRHSHLPERAMNDFSAFCHTVDLQVRRDGILAASGEHTAQFFVRAGGDFLVRDARRDPAVG